MAPIAFSLLPHEYIREAAVPVGFSHMWLGFALCGLERIDVVPVDY